MIFVRIKKISDQKKESEEDSGMIFEMHDRIREILTEYNDTLIGRCPICLEEFNE